MNHENPWSKVTCASRRIEIERLVEREPVIPAPVPRTEGIDTIGHPGGLALTTTREAETEGDSQ